MRKAIALAACVLLAPSILLLAEAARLPSASVLDPYLPTQPVTLLPQTCLGRPTPVVPTAALLPLEPALRAAEGPKPHYGSKIARTLLCQTSRHGMLRYHLDELLLTAKIRLRYSREQQFTIFLNRTYFGGDVPGAAASARRLFQRPVDRLTLAQQALLMGLIRAPRYFDPRDPPRAYARRNAVLDTMQHNGDITPEQADAAKHTQLDHEFDHAS